MDLAAGKIGLGTWASIASFDNVRFYPLNALATSVSFDPGFFKINAKTDESGISTLFTYDPLGRLTEIRDRANNLLKDFDYFYSSPFSATNPNYIEEKIYRDVTQLTTSRNWYDGLGRAVQAQQNLGTGSIKVGTVYDALNRPVKVTKPFSSTTQTFTTGDPVAAANSDYSNRTAYYPGYNPDTSPYAYFETEYYADPLDRVKKQAAPGNAFRMGSGKEVELEYLTNSGSEFSGYSPNTLLKQRRIDENENVTETFTDNFGNTVATIVDPGNSPALNLLTTFKYDVLGNLIESKDPRSLPTTYAYNTLSQLRQKATPDAGTTDYLYDKNGNLRFVKDAKGATGNAYFIYYKYDLFNRKIEEGTMTDPDNNCNQPNADNGNYPSSSNTAKIKYHYDFAGYATGAPQKNLVGRMDAIEYLTERYTQPGYVFYSYDDKGRVDWIQSHIPKSNVSDGNGSLSTQIEYDYDLQGNVTKLYFRRTFPPGASTDAFYVWYDYDELGRLEKVFASNVDVKPTTPEAQYTYWPGGQVKRLVLGGNAQGVDYLYNARDWLTQINHPQLLANKDPGNDSTTVVKDRFGESIGYNVQTYLANDPDYSPDFIAQYNGNISWMTSNIANMTNPVGASFNGWVFQYDKASRLTKANWGYNQSNNWQLTSFYDLPVITYDASGNLTQMTRNSQTGAPTAMTYNYTSGTNKLHKVAGLNGQGDNNYVYDANGNMTKDIAKLGAANTVTYDHRNLPAHVPIGSSPVNNIYFGYDGNGNRVFKNDLFYVYGADGKVIAVYNIDGTHLYWNIWGLDLIGQKFFAQ